MNAQYTLVIDGKVALVSYFARVNAVAREYAGRKVRVKRATRADLIQYDRKLRRFATG